MIDLAHLYEHIFCAHVTNLFYENHLFQRLDYSLTGKTYNGGIIYIEIEFYTKDALALVEKISEIKIDFSETTIYKGHAQLVAEAEEPLGGLGYEKTKQALSDLHNEPWETIDSLGMIDVKAVRRKAGPFYIADGKLIPARKLTTSVVLDTGFEKSHRELLPLFRQFAWLVTANIQNALCDTRGYFSFDDFFKNEKKTALTNIFHVAGFPDIHVDVNGDFAVCLRVIQDLKRYEVFQKFTLELCKLSYYNQSNMAPDPETSYEDTLIFMGSNGWKQIATPENCELLLKHMSIELKFGRQKVSSPLLPPLAR